MLTRALGCFDGVPHAAPVVAGVLEYGEGTVHGEGGDWQGCYSCAWISWVAPPRGLWLGLCSYCRFLLLDSVAIPYLGGPY